MNNVELNDELEQVTDFAAPVEEQKETKLEVSEDTKSLAKDLGEMAVVGIIIYGFCKLCDFLIDKIKAGVKKFKEKRAAKKAQKQAQTQQAAPVAQVAAPQTEVKTEETAQQ